MTAQILKQAEKAYRIGDPDGTYDIFDATGSGLYPGRWNTPASPMIYASADYSTSMLEKLVHGSGSIPPNQHYVEILLSAGLSYEVLSQPAVPGWDHPDCTASKAFGEAWHRSRRSLLLYVPSVVARVSNNILINPEHPDFSKITVGPHHPCWWDSRLFPGAATPASTPATSSAPPPGTYAPGSIATSAVIIGAPAGKIVVFGKDGRLTEVPASGLGRTRPRIDWASEKRRKRWRDQRK